MIKPFKNLNNLIMNHGGIKKTADWLGVSENTLRTIQRGNNNPSLRTVAKIELVTGLNFTHLTDYKPFVRAVFTACHIKNWGIDTDELQYCATPAGIIISYFHYQLECVEKNDHMIVYCYNNGSLAYKEYLILRDNEWYVKL